MAAISLAGIKQITHSQSVACEDGPALSPSLSQLFSVPPGSPRTDIPRSADAPRVFARELTGHWLPDCLLPLSCAHRDIKGC